MNKNKIYISLTTKIILIVYVLVFITSWLYALNSIKIMQTKMLENTIDTVLKEQFRIGYSIKKMAENLYYTNEDASMFLYGTIRNSADSYANYYADDSSFKISNENNETILFANIKDEHFDLFKTEQKKDGTVSYFINEIDNKNFVFVSSYIKIYKEVFRLDYMKDISNLSVLQKDLSYKIAFTLFFGEILLLILLYFTIKKTLKPLENLNHHAKEIAKGNYTKQLEIIHNDEIGQLSISFNNMQNAIEQQIISLSEAALQKELFASNLAHEIKTPITSIVAYSDFAVKSDANGEKLYDLLEYIKKEGQRLSELSEKILNWSDLNHNEASVAPCKTQKIINQILYTLKPLAEEKNQIIKISNKTKIIYVDEALMISLIINLCKNALNASNENTKIYLDINNINNELIITVKDNGIGIDKDELQKIIEPFYMIDKARDRDKSGNGLGLSFCKAIVDAHNGSMKIESKLGEGTCVVIKFPQNYNFDKTITSS